MKTIEEKAKAYDEALGRARNLMNQIQNNELIGFPDQFTEIFPELAESEDEKVRKEMLEFVSSADISEILDEETQARWYNYLQRQKEQKPHRFCDDTLKAIDKARELDEQEQKPAEWSEEDEENIESICSRLDSLLYTEDVVEKTNIVGEIAFLKSLRPHWKPSELEKGALRTAIHILTEERNFPRAAVQLQNILDAFEGKESRKDWKLSEEQMNTIGLAIQVLNSFGHNSLCCKLNALRDDLLKQK